MKKLLLAGIIALQAQLLNAQTYAWTQKADYGGGNRYAAAGFSIGTKGYIGTGITHTGSQYTYHNDFWEWDQATNTWTQKANFAGTHRYAASGFSIDQKGYITLGWSPSQLNDLWEYNPSNNIWTQKTNFGGSARYDAAAFVIGSFAYVGCGYSPYKKDFWKYDIVNDSWTQIADIGGQPRSTAAGFSIDNYGYVACGGEQFVLYTTDLWQYDPITNTWTAKADYAGAPRANPTAFAFGGKGYVGVGCTSSAVFSDFYSYDPVADSWSPIATFPGPCIVHGVGFNIGNRGYIGTGADYFYPSGNDVSEFWEYGPVTNGFQETGSNNNILVFSNPLDNLLQIKFNKETFKNTSIQAFDITGKLIISQKINSANTEISTGSFIKGNYLVEIFNESQHKIYSKKIFIQ